MIAIISPAKKIQLSPCGLPASTPEYLRETKRIIQALKGYEPWQLESLLKVNQSLALDAYLMHQSFDLSQKGSPALLSYRGLVFQHIGAEDFTSDQLLYANRHVRILSAAYGILKPLDGILPYRLEMQCKLSLDGLKNLYQFWKDKPYASLVKEDSVIVNLASEEYAKCIRSYLTPHVRMIDVEFLSFYKGDYKILPAWAKIARGEMVRFIVKNRPSTPEQLQSFQYDGYSFVPRLSSDTKYVFTRK
jgi:cytoplasmic iron level regulating protein YaaA (DUF328/UPF0246 family)